jgi:outer membrane protein assembly factor BamB
VDLEKNQKIWQVNLKKYNKYSDLDLDYINNKIIVSNGVNEVFVMDANNGETLGSRSFFSTPVSVKFLKDETIVISSLNNKTYALLDLDSLIWIHEGYNSEISTSGASNIIEYKDKIIVFHSSGEVYCLNQYDGSVVWSSDLITSDFAGIFTYLSDIDIDAEIEDEYIYVADNNGIIKSFSIDGGKEKWEIFLGERPVDFVVFEDKLALISQRKLYIINRVSGKIEKELIGDDVIKGFNSLQNILYYKKYLVINSRNKIFILEKNGNLLKEFKSLNDIITKPVVHKEKLYYADSGWFFNNTKYIDLYGWAF